jgi:hypothetical protein
MQRLLAEIEELSAGTKFMLVTKDRGRINGYVVKNKQVQGRHSGDYSVTADMSKASIFNADTVEDFLERFDVDSESIFYVAPMNGNNEIQTPVKKAPRKLAVIEVEDTDEEAPARRTRTALSNADKRKQARKESAAKAAPKKAAKKASKK